MNNEQADEELLMILEKYKEDIKFLHHQIGNQGLTPDEILAKEDTETNKAKVALLSLIHDHDQRIIAEAELKGGIRSVNVLVDEAHAFNRSPGNDYVVPQYFIDQMVTRAIRLEKRLAALTAQQDGQGEQNNAA